MSSVETENTSVASPLFLRKRRKKGLSLPNTAVAPKASSRVDLSEDRLAEHRDRSEKRNEEESHEHDGQRERVVTGVVGETERRLERRERDRRLPLLFAHLLYFVQRDRLTL